MIDGMIKVMAGVPEIRVADCTYNTGKIAEVMESALKQGVNLLVLPELGITGYTCGDLFHQKPLLDATEYAIAKLLKLSVDTDMITVLGAPLIQEGKLYNCAVVLHRGMILGIVPKSRIPNYNEFYELRHFTSAPSDMRTITVAGQTCPFGTNILFQCRENTDFVLAVEICEDLWVPNPPSISHAIAGATVIANLSAGDEVVGKAQYRRELVKSQSARLICGYIYADTGYGESTSDMVFSGHSIISENGTILAENQLFSMQNVISELDLIRITHDRMKMNTFPQERDGYTVIPFSMENKEINITRHICKTPFVPEDNKGRALRCESILTMQAEGLARRLEHTHSKCAVIGISGGLDSCLALLVTVRAMDRLNRPRGDILAVTMPCFGTTKRTRSNAEILCQALGVRFECVDITASVKQHFDDIGHSMDDLNVTFENGQARERTQVLMDIANREGGLVVGTGDLSELALGWATYNGDHMSMYGVNASIPKTLVRYLVAHVAETCGQDILGKTLLDILETPVSPELLPHKDNKISQKTEDLVGPYELHDFFLYYMLRFGFAPTKIYLLARHAFAGEYENKVILKWLKTFYLRFFAQQFKRSCLPDGPKVGTISVSPRGDLRMPSDASAAIWLAEIDDLSDK